MELEPSRGTKLHRNLENTLHVLLSTKELTQTIEILLIQGDTIEIQKLESNRNTIRILPHQEFLLVNLMRIHLTIEFNEDPDSLKVLFDPYQYEKNPYDVINPEEFKKFFSVPDGYIDILPKWYSIKFIYPKKNLIYLRPHLGVSIQSHSKRTEHWVIVKGFPIIIANSKMYYSVKPGDMFHTDSGKIHAIFNPTDDWIIIEESYTGEFEEEDIIRVFNPNHY